MSIQGWRVVPTDASCLGPIAKKQLPGFEQIFVSAPEGWRPKDLERRLYVARRRAEKRLENDEHFYIASLSGLVTVYKGLMMPVDLPNFYLDLAGNLDTVVIPREFQYGEQTIQKKGVK